MPLVVRWNGLRGDLLLPAATSLEGPGAGAARIPATGNRPVDVAVGGGLVYVVSMRDDVVTVLDETTLGVVGTTAAGKGAISVAAGADAAWVASSDDYSLTRIEAQPPAP